MVSSSEINIASSEAVHARIGMSPISSDFSIGAFRTLVANAACAGFFNGNTFLRIDDSNSAIHNSENILPLAYRLIDDIGLSISDATQTVGIESLGRVRYLRQSARQETYTGALQALMQSGFAITDDEGVVRLDLSAYMREFGPTLTYEYGYGRNTTTKEIVIDPQSIAMSSIGPSLTRPDGNALYHLASVIDDRDLGVGVVVRGADALSAQPVQVMLRNALGISHIRHLYAKRLQRGSGLEKESVLYGSLAKEFSVPAVNSYLFSTLTKTPEVIFTSFEEFCAAFTPEALRPGEDVLDLKRLASIQRKLGGKIG